MKLFRLTFLLISVAAAFSSCLKKTYDSPPDLTSYDPKLTVTHSIEQLKALNGAYNPQSGGETKFIDENITICGIVTANDHAGNFYKQMVIQDESAAIMILLDADNLYNDYPVGRKVYIMCKGLWLGYDVGLPVIGSAPKEQGVPNSIPKARVKDHIVKANTNNVIKPDTVDLKYIADTARPHLYNKLLFIREAQFSDTDKTYTQPSSTTNRDVVDCIGNKLAVRTSNYASFAGLPLPKGKGSLLGIYTVYINSFNTKTPQLVIRDTSDVAFHASRCGALTGTIILHQGFTGLSTGTLNISGWINYAEKGNKQYAVDSFGGAKFTKISGYSSGQAVIESWLITPVVNLEGLTNPRLNFKTLDGYDNGATLKVFVSANYTGSGNPADVAWTELQDINISNGHTSGYGTVWVPSGELDLSAFTGSIRIAFVYEGADPTGSANDKTTTFEIDDIVVAGD